MLYSTEESLNEPVEILWISYDDRYL